MTYISLLWSTFFGQYMAVGTTKGNDWLGASPLTPNTQANPSQHKFAHLLCFVGQVHMWVWLRFKFGFCVKSINQCHHRMELPADRQLSRPGFVEQADSDREPGPHPSGGEWNAEGAVANGSWPVCTQVRYFTSKPQPWL